MRKQLTIAFALLCTLPGCSVLKRSSNKELTDGTYRTRVNGKQQQVYVTVSEDTIAVHDIFGNTVDSASIRRFSKQELDAAKTNGKTFRRSSFDLDLLTIPFRLRPAMQGVPLQLNTNINASAYLGYRNDYHIISYKKGKLKQSDRTVHHYGYSAGLFSGIGNTFMSPTNTAGAINQEYDGVTWLKGIAGFVAVNNYTLGVAIGMDHLLDENNNTWIYQGKLWYGLAFGINLN